MPNRTLPVCLPALALGALLACNRAPAPPQDATNENPNATSTSPAPPDTRAELDARRARERTPDARELDDRDVRTAERRATERDTRDGERTIPSSQGTSRRELPRAGSTATLPAGTLLKVRITNTISTATAHTDDPVTGEIVDPIEVDGRTVVPAGTRVHGRVVAATTSGRMSRPASIDFEMRELLLPGGEQVAIQTTHFQRIGKGHTQRNAGLIAGGAAVGALVGQLAGKDTDSTLKGAAAGAAAGTGAAAATGELDFTIEPGEIITFRLEQPARL